MKFDGYRLGYRDVGRMHRETHRDLVHREQDGRVRLLEVAEDDRRVVIEFWNGKRIHSCAGSRFGLEAVYELSGCGGGGQDAEAGGGVACNGRFIEDKYPRH